MKAFIHQSAILNVFDTTDNESPIGKRNPEDDTLFHIVLASASKDHQEQTTTTFSFINPSTSRRYIDSLDEKLQMQIFHETFHSVTKEKLIFSVS